MAETLRDPVCGMELTYQTAQARSEYNGQTYYFHSLECKAKFDKDPERYVAQTEHSTHR